MANLSLEIVDFVVAVSKVVVFQGLPELPWFWTEVNNQGWL